MECGNITPRDQSRNRMFVRECIEAFCLLRKVSIEIPLRMPAPKGHTVLELSRNEVFGKIIEKFIYKGGAYLGGAGGAEVNLWGGAWGQGAEGNEVAGGKGMGAHPAPQAEKIVNTIGALGPEGPKVPAPQRRRRRNP